MSWDKRYIDFGLVKVDGQSRVKVYQNRDNYIYITVGNETITDVRWTGDVLTVYLKTGKVRRYRDRDNYIIIS
jgi:hypothetical protein